MISIPVLPEMLECIEEDEELATKYDMETIENVISGLFISFQSIGEAAGPIAASSLAEAYGFQTAQEIYCGFLAFFFVSYFCFCGNFKMFGREAVKYNEVNLEEADALVEMKMRERNNTIKEEDEYMYEKEGGEGYSFRKENKYHVSEMETIE